MHIHTHTHTHTNTCTAGQTSIKISYTSTGSGTGKKLLSANNVSFAGSDSAVSATDKVVIARQQRMIPVFAAAVGLMYNHKQVPNHRLCGRSMFALACVWCPSSYHCVSVAHSSKRRRPPTVLSTFQKKCLLFLILFM